MKKNKLLAPLLGAIAIASTALPLAACQQKPVEVVPAVLAINRNTDTGHFIKVNCDKDKVEDLSQDLTLDITWEGSPETKYYSEAISVSIGNEIYFVKTTKQQKGYIFNNYADDGNGINITIPQELLTKDDVIVNLYLKVATYDVFKKADAYIENGTSYQGTNYDIVSTFKEDDEKHTYFDVFRGERVEFAIDLNAYVAGRTLQGEPLLDGDIYFIFSYWDEFATQRRIIPLDNLTMDEVYWGEQKLFIENNEGIIRVLEPQTGWGNLQGKLPPITGWYAFQYGYGSVRIVAGQVHSES